MIKYLALWLIIFSAILAALYLIYLLVKNQLNTATASNPFFTLLNKL